MRSTVLASFALGAICLPALGQPCQPAWSATFGETGLNGFIRAAAVFDIDGPGPGGPVLVVGGSFTGAGTTALPGVAWFDGQNWQPVGDGPSGSVYDLAIFDADGPGPEPSYLYAAGAFSEQKHVRRWEFGAWVPVGGAIGNLVQDLEVFDEDGSGPALPKLFACGFLGFITTSNVMRWDGPTWSPVGSVTDGNTSGMAVFDEDGPGPLKPALFAFGDMATAGGASVNGVARWDGATWSAVGGGVDAFGANCGLAFDPDGPGPLPEALYVAGGFTTVGGGVAAEGIARWNGATWSSVGGGMPGNILRLTTFDFDGAGPQPASLVACGYMFAATPFNGAAIARLSGSTWIAVGGGFNQYAYGALAADLDGQGPAPERLVSYGVFTLAPSQPSAGPATYLPRIGVFDGAAWSAAGPAANGGASDTIQAIAEFDADGPGPGRAHLYAAGRLRHAGGVPVNHIARWDGADWSDVGGGLNHHVYALAVHDEDGPGPIPAALYAGGQFSTAGGSGAPFVARWNGSAWSGAGLPGNQVFALVSHDEDGAGPNPARLFAGGQGSSTAKSVRRFNGTTWTDVGTGTTQTVRALAVWDPDGSGAQSAVLVAGGWFTSMGSVSASRVAVWNGSAWSALGSGLNRDVDCLAAFDEDGPGPLPPSLFAGGYFTQAGGVSAYGLARWRGGSWSAAGGPLSTSAWVHSLAVHDADGPGPGGEALYVGGSFWTSITGTFTRNIARWSGTSWSAPGTGVDGPVHAMASYSEVSGRPGLYAGGRMLNAGSTSSAAIARWGCPVCYADCNGDGSLNLADFGCFQTKFALQDPYADCNGDGVLNLADFGCFQTKFALGCP